MLKTPQKATKSLARRLLDKERTLASEGSNSRHSRKCGRPIGYTHVQCMVGLCKVREWSATALLEPTYLQAVHVRKMDIWDDRHIVRSTICRMLVSDDLWESEDQKAQHKHYRSVNTNYNQRSEINRILRD